MRRKKEALILGPLLKKLARRIGAQVVIEPEWGIVGQITFQSGKKSYFRYNTLDLNPVGASDVAKDKDYAAFFMRKMSYPTVRGDAFFSDEWARAIGSKKTIDSAYRFARKIGFPVIVKPNSGSQGTDVSLVNTKQEFYTTLKKIFKHDRIALVQRYVSGRDYRIVVLDKQVISAYERIPLSVIGDGRATILQLLKRKQKEFSSSNRDTLLKPNDPRIAQKLRRQRLSLRSVPSKGVCVYLLDNANLSSGGDAVDVTESMHQSFKKLAIDFTRDMGLRMSGVDLMVQGDIREKAKKYWILEINAAPGLDHYASSGKEQEKIVENLYFKVLKSLSR